MHEAHVRVFAMRPERRQVIEVDPLPQPVRVELMNVFDGRDLTELDPLFHRAPRELHEPVGTHVAHVVVERHERVASVAAHDDVRRLREPRDSVGRGVSLDTPPAGLRVETSQNDIDRLEPRVDPRRGLEN